MHRIRDTATLCRDPHFTEGSPGLEKGENLSQVTKLAGGTAGFGTQV